MKDQVVDEVAGSMSERAEFYRLLASLYFKEVSEEFIARLKGLPAELSDEAGLLGEGFKELRDYFARRGPDPRTDLAADYARIFLAAGMFEGDAGCPYESIYTSEEKLVMQEARDEVRAVYLAHSVNVNEELRLPEDHLSFELEFLAILSDRAAELAKARDMQGLVENLKTQVGFIDAHLLNWLEKLEERVIELARHRFYPAIMHITEGYLEQDRAFLSEACEALA